MLRILFQSRQLSTNLKTSATAKQIVRPNTPIYELLIKLVELWVVSVNDSNFFGKTDFEKCGLDIKFLN